MEESVLKSLATSSSFVDLKIHYVDKSLQVDDLVKKFCSEAEDEEPFYIVDLTKLVTQYEQWKEHLPNIHPYYELGVNFDCASKNEIKMIMDINVDASRIIYAHPCKPISHIKYAKSVGVSMTTFDNEEEIYKLAKYWPEAKAILRIAVDDKNSKFHFSKKFGAKKYEWKNLIKKCKEHSIDLYGVSFHVGFMCGKEEQYTNAIQDALEFYQMAKEEGYTLKLLDIGGGFPGFHTYRPTFPEFAATIRKNLKESFGDLDIEIISEPGTYFAASTHILVCNVIAKRILDNRFIYYINDGFYGGIGPIWHCLIKPKLHLLKQDENEPTYSSTVFGPTCDSIDLIYDDIQLPELNIGDWLYFYETVIGAYGANLVTPFNGFGTEKKYYIWRK